MDAFYPLPGQFANATARPSGERYAYHLPGLPVLMVPFWIVGGWFGLWWPATIVFMCVVGALVSTNVFLLAYEVSGRLWIAVAVWAAMAFSNPVMSYSYMIFTELAVGLLLVYTLRRLAMGWGANGPWRLLLVGICVGYIPWLAWRCVLISVPVLAYGVVQWWRYVRMRRAVVPKGERASVRSAWHTGRLALLVGPVIISAALMASYYNFLFGKLLPDTSSDPINGAAFYWPWSGASQLASFAETASGLLFDREAGLLVFAPVYLLAAVGCIALFRSRRGSDRRLLAAIAFTVAIYWFVIMSYIGWNGIWSPPARYAATVVPLLAAPLAMSLLALSRSSVYKVLFGAMALVGFFFMAVMLADSRPHVAQPHSS